MLPARCTAVVSLAAVPCALVCRDLLDAVLHILVLVRTERQVHDSARGVRFRRLRASAVYLSPPSERHSLPGLVMSCSSAVAVLAVK